MKLLVFSDTHRSLGIIQKILAITNEMSPDLVIHLGDYYDDITPDSLVGIPLIRVPGTWTAFYQNPMIENRRIEVFEGWRFLLSHTPEIDSHDLPDDPDPQKLLKEGACDVFLHGHTHQADLYQKEGVIICNPGHLSEKDLRSDHSFAIMTLDSEILDITIQNLSSDNIICSNSFEKR
tara:strand:+ start:666 stop:1199 length:534 start_codon:yes stop_codon:yes gene_type:complete